MKTTVRKGLEARIEELERKVEELRINLIATRGDVNAFGAIRTGWIPVEKKNEG